MAKDSINREYCAWEALAVDSREPGGEVFLRGDLAGPMDYDGRKKLFRGVFEFPARGGEKGWFEIVRRLRGAEETLRRTAVDYSFDSKYFSPRWENVKKINRFLADYYPESVRLETVYRYESVGREIQLLVIAEGLHGGLRDKQVVLVTGRVHNPESGMTAVCYRFVKWLLSGGGGEYLKDYVFLVIPMTIPLTFEEDGRGHDVNRLWQPEITAAADIDAVRERVIDKYIPEAWIDCHSFNSVLPLGDPSRERMECGDYVVAHPVGEKFFDRPYSTDIALRMIGAAERAGHRHRNGEFFRDWELKLKKSGPARPGEIISTDYHPAGIFSGGDYARYADRLKFGAGGRDWPAMACEYGYFRCHAINMCLECKPLHVSDGSREGFVHHYPQVFPDSNLQKLKELCLIGRDDFSGQPFSGFPCNVVASDTDGSPGSVMLCAWGGDREELRRSRYALWKNRFSITMKKLEEGKTTKLILKCFGDIECPAALRVPAKGPGGGGLEGETAGEEVERGEFLYVPVIVRKGCAVWSLRCPPVPGSGTQGLLL